LTAQSVASTYSQSLVELIGAVWQHRTAEIVDILWNGWFLITHVEPCTVVAEAVHLLDVAVRQHASKMVVLAHLMDLIANAFHN
jgi:hypothetical protein